MKLAINAELLYTIANERIISFSVLLLVSLPLCQPIYLGDYHDRGTRFRQP